MSTVHAGRWDTRQKCAVKLVPRADNRYTRTRDVLCTRENAGSTYRSYDQWGKYGHCNVHRAHLPQATYKSRTNCTYDVVKCMSDSYGNNYHNKATQKVRMSKCPLVASIDVIESGRMSEDGYLQRLNSEYIKVSSSRWK